MSFYSRPQTAAERRKLGKKRQLAERELPTQLDILVPESRLYSKLLKFEQRVDATIARKHIELQEALAANTQQNVILRVLLYNEFNQDESSVEPAGWTMRIQGQVLDPETLSPLRESQFAFSNFLSKVVVQIDPREYKGPDSTIVWRKDTAVSVCDGFEIKRRGDQECDCKISMWLDTAPMHYTVAKPLAVLIGVETDTMANILNGVWQYVKSKKLQDAASPTTIRLNKELQKVFPGTAIETGDLVNELKVHLRPPDPVMFRYRIKLDGEDNAECYDLAVNCPGRFSVKFHNNTDPKDQNSRPNMQIYTDIHKVEDKIYENINDIHQHLRRREFLRSFTDSPVDAINLLLTAQHNELQNSKQVPYGVMMQDKSEVFQQEWVPDAVDRYLRTLEPSEEEGLLGTPKKE